VSADDLAHVAKITQKVARAAVSVFAADGVTIQQFNEPAGGQVVFHLHVHVIPRKSGVALKPPASFKEESSVLADHAQRLSAALRAG
jgi:histidine triad (HIT) family protein